MYFCKKLCQIFRLYNRKNSIKQMKDYLTAVKNFPVPEIKKNIRQFLGKINVYNKFIPHSAIILNSLYNLLRKNI